MTTIRKNDFIAAVGDRALRLDDATGQVAALAEKANIGNDRVLDTPAEFERLFDVLEDTFDTPDTPGAIETRDAQGQRTPAGRQYYALLQAVTDAERTDEGPRVRPEVLRSVLDRWSGGKLPEMSRPELMTLQASALRTSDRLFTNEFGNDGPLKSQVQAKLGNFKAYRRDLAFDDALFGGAPTDRMQAKALSVILNTFVSDSESDTALRIAVLEKLGRVGNRDDVAAVLPRIRKGNSADLHHGLEAVRSITARHGSPQRRGGLWHDPVIAPLLHKVDLSDAERNQVVEAVLRRGEIDPAQTRRHSGSNRNEVIFLTFKETFAGPNGTRIPIRAVWKPERSYFGKDHAFYSREVAAYEFDRQFARTGLVPPTIEGILSHDPRGAPEVGSLQWMVPGTPLGTSVTRYDPRFDELRKTSGFKAQEAQVRTLLFALSDPDKFGNNVIRTPNLQNLMVEPNGRLWMIDNAYSLGAPPYEVHRKILPESPDPALTRSLKETLPNEVIGVLGDYIEDRFAEDAARRIDYLAEVQK